MRTAFACSAAALLLAATGNDAAQTKDWLVERVDAKATVTPGCWFGGTVCGLELSNELVTRRFMLSEDKVFGTVDWMLNATSARGGLQSMYRAIE